jgi:hypothetical protein
VILPDENLSSAGRAVAYAAQPWLSDHAWKIIYETNNSPFWKGRGPIYHDAIIVQQTFYDQPVTDKTFGQNFLTVSLFASGLNDSRTMPAPGDLDRAWPLYYWRSQQFLMDIELETGYLIGSETSPTFSTGVSQNQLIVEWDLTRAFNQRITMDQGIQLRLEEVSTFGQFLTGFVNDYTKSKQRFVQFSYDQQLFEIVRTNYIEFAKAMSGYLAEYVDNPSMNWSRADEIIKEANRLILNFLSSVRTFLDHSELHLKRRYGKDSQQVKRYEEICSQQYDGEFSYRFVYQLRNYVQHCGMPVGHFSLSSKLVDDSWGKQLENEIRQLPA